jgi:hypothetical protein
MKYLYRDTYALNALLLEITFTHKRIFRNIITQCWCRKKYGISIGAYMHILIPLN